MINFVISFLKRLRQSESAAQESPSPDLLRGVPAIRRMKHYAALSGYAYEYCFEGYRNRPAVREYVFSASGDRKNWNPISILLPDAALERWRSGRRAGVG